MTFYRCKCFFTHNYFIPQLSLHAKYESREQFLQDYKLILEDNGYNSESKKIELIEQMEKEKIRRKELGVEAARRKQIIHDYYQPLHSHVYHLSESFLTPQFLTLVEICNSNMASNPEEIKKQFCQLNGKIYTFPTFTQEFCNDFVEELLHFEKSDMPRGRPNTMNNYGILLDELGFDENLLIPLREKYLSPIARVLYPECGGDSLDSHKAFVVEYGTDLDTELSYHYDNAEVTFNVCLGKDFEGGSLYFGNMRQAVRSEFYTEVAHKVSCGVIHRGQHMHGALPLSVGQRYNLIIWMRSSKVRNKLCPMCDSKPQIVKTVFSGDGYTPESINVCTLG